MTETSSTGIVSCRSRGDCLNNEKYDSDLLLFFWQSNLQMFLRVPMVSILRLGTSG